MSTYTSVYNVRPFSTARA